MFTLQQKKEAFKKLRDSTKDFIVSNENIEIIEAVAARYALSEDLADKLDSEAHDIMIGLQGVSQMEANLISLGIPTDEADSITSELNNQIFLKLENLKNTPTGELPDHLVSTPTGLISGNTQTDNLPEVIGSEAQIMPLVGTPGEKLAWEQRKQKIGETEIAQSNYGTVDPYREPLA